MRNDSFNIFSSLINEHNATTASANDEAAMNDTPSFTRALRFLLRRKGELCSTLLPPPVPPWWLDTPDRLRHLVDNCSGWKNYADVCSLQMLPDYALALTDYPASEAVVVRWIPFIIAISLGLLITASVTMIYYLYKSNRLKWTFFLQYHLQDDYSRQPYNHNCIPNSVTVETQLSFCALSEETYSTILPSHLVFSELPSGGASDASELTSSGSGYATPQSQTLHSEIILDPHRLSYQDIASSSSASYTSSNQFYSSHSLPIDSTGETIITKNRSLKSNSDHQESDYVQLTREPTAPVSENQHRSIKAGKMQGMVQKCQKVGASLYHRVTWRRKSSHDEISAEHRKPLESFSKFKWSFHCKLRQKPSRQRYVQKVLSNGTACRDSIESKQCPDAASMSNTNSDGDSFASLGERLETGRKAHPSSTSENRKEDNKQDPNLSTPLTHEATQQTTFLNVTFEGLHEKESMLKMSPLKKIKMPALFYKLNPNRKHH